MNWIEPGIQQCLWIWDDRLVEESKQLVDDTEIYKPGGLSTSQIHNLLQEARRAKSIDRLKHFVDDQAKRSFPREPGNVTKATGKGWKFGWSKDDNGKYGEYFSDRLNDYLSSKLDSYAKAGASEINSEYQKEIAIVMARKFLTYLSWYTSWKLMKLQESEGN